MIHKQKETYQLPSLMEKVMKWGSMRNTGVRLTQTAPTSPTTRHTPHGLLQQQELLRAVVRMTRCRRFSSVQLTKRGIACSNGQLGNKTCPSVMVFPFPSLVTLLNARQVSHIFRFQSFSECRSGLPGVAETLRFTIRQYNLE